MIFRGPFQKIDKDKSKNLNFKIFSKPRRLGTSRVFKMFLAFLPQGDPYQGYFKVTPVKVTLVKVNPSFTLSIKPPQFVYSTNNPAHSSSPIAQLVERLSEEHVVLGSNPNWIQKIFPLIYWCVFIRKFHVDIQLDFERKTCKHAIAWKAVTLNPV